MELLPERSTKGEGSLNPNTDTNSISTAKLLNGVEKSYEKGKYLLDTYSNVVDKNGEPLAIVHSTDKELYANKERGQNIFSIRQPRPIRGT